MQRKAAGILLIALLLLNLFGCEQIEAPWEKPEGVSSQPAAPVGERTATKSAPTSATDKAPEPYCRSLLSGVMLGNYELILDGLTRHLTEIDLLNDEDENISKVIDDVMADNPQLFWCTGGGNTATSILNTVYYPDYVMSKSQAAQAQLVIERRVSAFFSTIAQTASDYDKTLAVFEYIINETEYDLTLERNSIYNVLVLKRGLCGCYAKTTQYLLNRLGIPCVTVSGEASNDLTSGSHAWNLVQLDGDWCWLDTTWGDPLSLGDQINDYINYDYFCVTTAEIERNHWDNDAFSVPNCTAVSCNYDRKNGLYLESYDFETVQALVMDAFADGKREARMRFASEAAYTEAVKELFGDDRVFDILHALTDSNRCNYTMSDTNWTICIALP